MQEQLTICAETIRLEIDSLLVQSEKSVYDFNKAELARVVKALTAAVDAIPELTDNGLCFYPPLG